MPTASVPKATSQPAGASDVEKPAQHIVEVTKIGLATAGAALVAYLAYRLARRKDDRSNFLAAGTKFREAFAADLVAIDNGQTGYAGLSEFLRTGYTDRHAVAVTAFEPFVRANERAAFCDDWNRYRYGQNKDGTPTVPNEEDGLQHDELLFLCYTEPGITWESHIGMAAEPKAIMRIKKLLSYASET